MMKLSMILAAVAATGAVGAPEKQEAAGDAAAPVSGQLHARLRELEFATLPTAKESGAVPERMTYSGEVATFQVPKGSCKARGRCVCTSNYDNECDKYNGDYENNEACDITYVDKYAGSMLSATAFVTEFGYDKLTVNNEGTFEGTSGPSGVVLKANGDIRWRSDGSVTTSGWVLCMEAAPCGLNEYRTETGGACKAVEAPCGLNEYRTETGGDCKAVDTNPTAPRPLYPCGPVPSGQCLSLIHI